MTVDTAFVPKGTISGRLRWIIGLLVFAAACYAIFGWLFDRTIQDAAGNRLIFYLGWHEGEFAALAFVLGGLAIGAVLLLLIGPLVAQIRSTAVFVVVQLLLFAVGVVLLLIWAVACFVIMIGAGMGSMDPVIAPDGRQVLLDRSAAHGGIVSVWVPHSRFMYAELPQQQLPDRKICPDRGLHPGNEFQAVGPFLPGNPTGPRRQ